MFSGWGVRTISTDDRGYNPIGYHGGTIWPHDNAIVAAGLARYGFRDEANRIALAQIEAAAFSDFRLPGGVRRLRALGQPLPGAVPDRVQSRRRGRPGRPSCSCGRCSGLEARDGVIRLDPHVPEEIGRISPSTGCMRSGRSGTSRR